MNRRKRYERGKTEFNSRNNEWYQDSNTIISPSLFLDLILQKLFTIISTYLSPSFLLTVTTTSLLLTNLIISPRFKTVPRLTGPWIIFIPLRCPSRQTFLPPLEVEKWRNNPVRGEAVAGRMRQRNRVSYEREINLSLFQSLRKRLIKGETLIQPSNEG